jgi:hypothetical protein
MGIIETRLNSIYIEGGKEFAPHTKILPAKMMLEYIYTYEVHGWYKAKSPYLTEALLKLVKDFFKEKRRYSFSAMVNLLEVFIYYGHLFPELFSNIVELSSSQIFRYPEGIHNCIKYRISIENSIERLKLLKECTEIIQSKISCPNEKSEYQKQIDSIITKMQCNK